MQEDLFDWIFDGVKEVTINDLIPEKTYLYFRIPLKSNIIIDICLKMLELNRNGRL